MRKVIVSSLVAILFLSTTISFYSEARKYGYRSQSYYRPPAQNNYYNRQQAYRNNQLAQQRQQQQLNRQREQQRIAAQRNAQREAQRRQQKIVRDRQVAMQKQMQQRQRRALEQQSKRLRQQQQKRLGNQASKLSDKFLAQKSKELQQRIQLREQSKRKERKQKLDKLAKDRLARLKKQQKQDDDKQLGSALVSLRSLGTSNTNTNTSATTSIKQFQRGFSESLTKPRLKQIVGQTRSYLKDKLTRQKVLDRQLQVKRKSTLVASQTAQKKRVSAKVAEKNFKNCPQGVCQICSFHGDTLVKTIDGFKEIRNIVPYSDLVWARDEFTGESDWKLVTNFHDSTYEHTVTVSYRASGEDKEQSIKVSEIHPFYVSIGNRHNLEFGTNATGTWKEAQHLRVGDQLLSENEALYNVTEIQIDDSALEAFNLTVDEFKTFFVKGNGEGFDSSVWVHNSCGNKATKVGDHSKVVLTTTKQIQKKFKHAKDFGVSGNYNAGNARKFYQALQKHINSPDVRELSGTYRGKPVIFHTNPNTGLTVIQKLNGGYLSGWRLNSKQLNHVLKNRKL